MTGNRLKKIALIAMSIDHIAASYILRYLAAWGVNVDLKDLQNMSGHAWAYLFCGGEGANAFQNMSGIVWMYLICRWIGRIAFPIYLFLLAEGVKYTHNIKKYILTLTAFAFISEIPFDMALWLQDYHIFAGKLFYWGYQNVYFTLALSALAMALVKKLDEKCADRNLYYLGTAWIYIIAATIAFLLKSDYGYAGVLAAGVIYMFRDRRKVAMALAVAILTALVSLSEIWAAPVIWLVGAYNGERGMKGNKYFFYLFYPAHFLLLTGMYLFSGL